MARCLHEPGAVLFTQNVHTCLSVCSRLLLPRVALSGLTTAAATSRPIEGGKQVRTLTWLRPPDCDWSMTYLVEAMLVRLKLTAKTKQKTSADFNLTDPHTDNTYLQPSCDLLEGH